MAESKTKNEAAKAENVTENQAAVLTADPGEELVDYFAPILPGENRQDIFVAVNGESLVIKRGVNVKIRRKFYEVLMNAQDQERCAYEAMENARRQGEKALTNM